MENGNGLASATTLPVPDPLPELLTVKEAAEFLGFHRVTVSRLAHARKLPARKIGHEWRFSRRRLMEWIESGGAR